ncbi:MAG: threonine/serine dehydratase [Bryobacteraceae bacterium]
MSHPVNLTDVREADVRIRPVAKRTPVLTSESFNQAAGVRTFFKCENFQKGGAFKIRGAANLVFSLTAAERARGLVAFSSGNHAQAVALAAREVGATCTIVMPTDAPKSKVEATRGYGANVVTYDRMKEDREAIAAALVRDTNAVLVPPFDHPKIIAGQGTAALELMEEMPDLDAILTPVGGGGLLSGSAIAARGTRPGIRVFGVEPEQANDTFLSFRRGERVTIPPPDTIADGLRLPSPGKLTFPIVQDLVEDILLVSEDEIRAAVRYLLTRLKILVEPSGAVPAAAVLFGRLPKDIRTAGVILSGGNVDYEVLAKLGS